MSCDRRWKLLLGGLQCLVRGLYISKVKSKHCVHPILSFTPSLLWKHCLICSHPQHKHTHAPKMPPRGVVKWTIASKSKSSSMSPLTCSVEKNGNTWSPNSHSSMDDKLSSQRNTVGQFHLLTSYLVSYKSDSSAKRRSWAGDRFDCATVLVCRGMNKAVGHGEMTGGLRLMLQRNSYTHTVKQKRQGYILLTRAGNPNTSALLMKTDR